jgi:arabinofuranosyltransferase
MLLLGAPGLRRWIDVAVGMIPLLVWELFSLVYYGALVPNTAIAKLGDAGLSRELLVERGLAYLHEGLTLDPLTLPLIALGVVLAVAGPRRSTMPTAAGVLLYLAYVVWIGGDFMAGRFLAAPMLGAVFIITQRPWWERLRWLAPAAAAALLALVLRPAMPSPFDPDYHALLDARGTMTPHQVADERAVYQQRFGLWVRWKQGELAQEQVDGPHDLIVFEEVAGWNAFIAGPGCHVVNPYGLSDPLVARMPADPPGQERAGHVTRTIPPRYLDSLRTGENLLEDPDQHALLDDLWSATRAPLSDPDRPAAILRLLRPR